MVSEEIEGLLTAAREAWLDRDLQRARALIEQAMARSPAGEQLATARIRAGVIYQQLGDVHLSMVHLQALIGGWDEYPGSRPLLEGVAWYNLGLTLYQRREYEAALRAHETAAVCLRRESLHEYLRMCLQWQAWLLTGLGRTSAALVVLEVAEGLCEGEDAQVRQRLCYAYAALADTPAEALEQARDLARQTDRPDVLCYLACIGGRALLTLGRLSEARQLAEAAIQAALDAQDMRCLSDAQRLKREIVEAVGMGA